ncbi:TonB-dependent vitamin B12 receptor [Nitrogeniibacter aestuarii]|uniref:TonB-dependent vitamin B12 receptor n=1 Tax=Nitrogeniibacter aestuarii TaxID=2815343 RepID=UPI001D108C97|nr:TonB-dependent vitamin B12 receptor [Nitrogeniibacter aestuarii]
MSGGDAVHVRESLLNIRFSCAALAASLGVYAPFTVADTEAETTVVTATRTARTVDETLSSVTVITRADIERLQPESVVDLLRGQAGVSFTNNGGRGKNTSVFLRGAESDQVLVMIDGVKVGSATSGSAAFQDMPLELIERVEIVRGPRSSLYGSEAIGGVIQIFTRKAGVGFKPFVTIGAGTDSHFSGGAGLSYRSERGWIGLSLNREITGGFDVCRENTTGKGNCQPYQADRDGYQNNAVNLNAGLNVGASGQVSFNWLKTESKSSFDGNLQNESEGTQEVAGLQASFKPFEIWKTTFAVGVSKDQSNNYLNGRYVSTYDTQRTTASWQNDISLSEGILLTVGVDGQTDEVDSTTQYAQTARDNIGYFLMLQAATGAHDLELSLRKDDNEQFGQHVTGAFAWGVALNEQVRLVTSYATAFKAPTFNELYFPGYGNPDLNPESSETIEIGVRGRHDQYRWGVTVFETTVDDLIAYDAWILAPNNVSSALIQGAELTGGFDIDKLSVNAALTLLDTSNEDEGLYEGNWLARRPAQSARLDIDYDFGRVSTGATVIAEGKRYDDLGNTQKLDGYTTLDLRASFRLAPAWTLQATVGNVFDREYETARFYNQPGRSAFLTLRYAP